MKAVIQEGIKENHDQNLREYEKAVLNLTWKNTWKNTILDILLDFPIDLLFSP